MTPEPARPAPIPAATVVLLRPAGDGRPGFEVLLTRRPATMRFGPGMHVFPGGRLEAGESASAAATRETAEETGIELDPASLVALSRWVTPLGLASRFDTRFFGAIVPPRTDVRHASDEVADWSWIRPTAALEAMAAGKLAMWQPTVVTLQQVEELATRDLLAATFGTDRSAEDRELDGAGAPNVSGARPFPHAWAGGVEGRPGTTWVIGARAWVVVDPGDPTGETVDAIVAAAGAAGGTLAGVLVGDLEPDRHAGVELFARGMGLPVAGPPGANAIAPYEVLELEDRDRVPFGDAGVAVEVLRSGDSERDVGAGAWSARAGRLRMRHA